MKREIALRVQKTFSHLGVGEMPSFLVESSQEATHGEYATNAALAAAKPLKRNPLDLAKEAARYLAEDTLFEKVEVAGPGFINFYLRRDFFIRNVRDVLRKKEKFGKNGALKRKKVVVEYTDPNPFKEFHIGHLMSNAIGESLARLFEFQSAKVTRVNYQGDVGLHVAKALWGKAQQGRLDWGGAYAYGAAQYKESEAAKQAIISLNKKIYAKSDAAVNRLYEEGKKESLRRFAAIYKKLGTKFDGYFFESQVSASGKKLVEKNMGKVFERGEGGAVIFKGENAGLHTRVFVNGEGLPTYEAKELALAWEKYKKYKYDVSIIVTANEVNDYFKVILAAMARIFPGLAAKTVHIGHGMMRLPEGKMSSRTGNVVTAESLIAQAREMILRKISARDFSATEKDAIAGQVAVASLKYSILKQAIGGDMVYDFEKSISFEGDSGPYLQYSHARALSVLRKAASERLKASVKEAPPEASQLERAMVHFGEAVESAGRQHEPHLLVTYLTDLARKFNHYYAREKIIDATDPCSPYKLAVVEAFSLIMKNGLWLLGISAPEQM